MFLFLLLLPLAAAIRNNYDNCTTDKVCLIMKPCVFPVSVQYRKLILYQKKLEDVDACTGLTISPTSKNDVRIQRIRLQYKTSTPFTKGFKMSLSYAYENPIFECEIRNVSSQEIKVHPEKSFFPLITGNVTQTNFMCEVELDSIEMKVARMRVIAGDETFTYHGEDMWDYYDD
ncbi:hypothetical protein PFISCL1PPCAC_719, partial [Pristionchus fissidentatus]